MHSIGLLVDNMIRSYGNVAESISIPVSGFSNPQLLIQAKRARSTNEKWLQNQIEALPTIARLAREGRLTLSTYIELEFECQRSNKSFPANLFGNVFAGVPISHRTGPIDRSKYFQLEPSEYVRKEAQTEFCIWLRSLAKDALPKREESTSLIAPEQLNGLQNLDRYREICHSLDSSQYIDAFHLWTGEVNGVDKFLTTDTKLVNALSTNRQLELKCKPIFPADLLESLEVNERDPLPFQYGRRYTLNGIPYD